MSEKIYDDDAHKKLLDATILDGQNQEKQTKKFQNNQTDITNLKTGLKQNQCLKIVIESTRHILGNPIFNARRSQP
ncbi:MAG: hypothetical protein FWF66_04895 [Candidatus Bathyarchaeota archaeon]|nr:hypothetical protein [Candidatus Termiticorpusculum sp.]